ncbi:MAG: 3-oxoacyl-[acyl-carrier-protein] synthase III C-terminal domain-containing protein [Candidatus Berkiella sp.]
MQHAYITSVGTYLPGLPVDNKEMEAYLGLIHGMPSRRGAFVLRQNRIRQRHYALDKQGNPYTTSAKMAAEAATNAIKASENSLHDIDYLSCASTLGDILVPGLASHVHGELKLPPLEIANFQSVCSSSMMALKSAYLQVKLGEKHLAAVTASEFASRYFRPGFYENTPDTASGGGLGMEAEFLRWTLSDGAGCVLVEPRPNTHQPALRIEWIDLCSYADRFKSCMTAGLPYGDHLDMNTPWSHYGSPHDASKNGGIVLRQDFNLLKEMLPVWVGHFFSLVQQGKIVIPEIDWFLCHYSAHSLREEIIELAERAGCLIPPERWYTNLYTKGNTGSAALFIMLEELMYSGKLKSGQKLLCAVPESGRSIISHMLLTVV